MSTPLNSTFYGEPPCIPAGKEFVHEDQRFIVVLVRAGASTCNLCPYNYENACRGQCGRSSMRDANTAIIPVSEVPRYALEGWLA